MLHSTVPASAHTVMLAALDYVVIGTVVLLPMSVQAACACDLLHAGSQRGGNWLALEMRLIRRRRLITDRLFLACRSYKTSMLLA